jgi:hypothetical protein
MRTSKNIQEKLKRMFALSSPALKSIAKILDDYSIYTKVGSFPDVLFILAKSVSFNNKKTLRVILEIPIAMTAEVE